MNPRPRLFLGLLHRREIVLPSFRGWVVLALVAALGSILIARNLYGFLARHEPIPGGVLVVEGWAGTVTLASALDEFRRGGYQKFYVTGGPIDEGDPLSEFGTCANLGRHTLIKLGANPADIEAVPSPAVVKDRTYASAIVLKQLFRERGAMPKSLNLVSIGVHCRRSHLLYRMAFRDEVKIGIVSINEPGFDPAHWWRSSGGVRAMVGEVVAYLYAALVFRPPPGDQLELMPPATPAALPAAATP